MNKINFLSIKTAQNLYRSFLGSLVLHLQLYGDRHAFQTQSHTGCCQHVAGRHGQLAASTVGLITKTDTNLPKPLTKAARGSQAPIVRG